MLSCVTDLPARHASCLRGPEKKLFDPFELELMHVTQSLRAHLCLVICCEIGSGVEPEGSVLTVYMHPAGQTGGLTGQGQGGSLAGHQGQGPAVGTGHHHVRLKTACANFF